MAEFIDLKYPASEIDKRLDASMMQQEAESGVVTKQLLPNTHYVFGECSSLTITFGVATSGIANEYSFEFTSGTTPTTLSLPDSVKWLNDKPIEIEASKKYAVSVLNNLAVWGGFAL